MVRGDAKRARGDVESWASTPAVRRSMLANRGVDTAPEIELRSRLHRAGMRFRKHRQIDVGTMKVKPDVVFPGPRVAVFVDGCFWHRCPEHGSEPVRNGDFWREKLDRNVERDRRVDALLGAAGWKVLRLWEHVPPEDGARAILDVLEEQRA
jgi:DNA mismatch endonuclease (patch repair protein)